MTVSASGVHVEIGGVVRWSHAAGSQAILFWAPRKSAAWVLAGMVVVTGAAGLNLGQRFPLAFGAMAFAMFSIMVGWLAYVFTATVSYNVKAEGVERVIVFLWKFRSRRRWMRDQIDEVLVWNRWGTGTAAENVGLVLRGGRRVILASGERGAVGAFGTVLRRELGIGEGD